MLLGFIFIFNCIRHFLKLYFSNDAGVQCQGFVKSNCLSFQFWHLSFYYYYYYYYYYWLFLYCAILNELSFHKTYCAFVISKPKPQNRLNNAWSSGVRGSEASKTDMWAWNGKAEGANQTKLRARVQYTKLKAVFYGLK